jgi:hypothetical protein
VEYASTAGHCEEPGVSIFHQSTTQRIGFVGTKYRNHNEHVDFEFIKMTAGAVSGTVWVGSRNTTDLRAIAAADNDGTLTGVTVCSSGANGGLVCGVIANRTAAFAASDGVTTLRLTCVRSTGTLTQDGDSGGPWLSTFANGTVMAWGQHKGLMNCDNTAGSDMVFSTAKNIALRAGATMITATS